MKHLASLRLFTLLAVLFPAFAEAHPGHGADDGLSHDMAHLGLGVAALLLALGLGFAAKTLQARARAHAAKAEEAAAVGRVAPDAGR